MSTTISTILLWLFVINFGIAFGAGLYEHRIVAPGWLNHDGSGPHWNAEAARRDDTGLRFWAYVTTGPHTADAGESGCCLENERSRAWLVDRCGARGSAGSHSDVLGSHPDDDRVDERSRFIGRGCRGNAMDEPQSSAPCFDTRCVAGGVESAFVAITGMADARRRLGVREPLALCPCDDAALTDCGEFG